MTTTTNRAPAATTDATLGTSPAVAAEPDVRRIAALGGFGFAACVLAENALRGAAPIGGASAAEVSDYYGTHLMGVTIASGLFVIALPCILVWSAGLRQVFRAQPIGKAGVGGIYAMTALFSAVVALDATLASLIDAGRLTSDGVTIVAGLHDGAFVLNEALLGTLFLLLSVGATRHPELPRWIGPFGLVGASMLLVAVIGVVPVVGGAPIGLLGAVGFLFWLVWVVAVSISMRRA